MGEAPDNGEGSCFPEREQGRALAGMVMMVWGRAPEGLVPDTFLPSEHHD